MLQYDNLLQHATCFAQICGGRRPEQLPTRRDPGGQAPRRNSRRLFRLSTDTSKSKFHEELRMKAIWSLLILATCAVSGWVNVGQEQARGMEHISRAIPQMRQATQKTADGPNKARRPARICRRMPPTCRPWCTKCGKWW